MRAELIFVGDELVLGETLNTHAAYLGASLAEEGIAVARAVTVGDDLAAVAGAVREALDRAELVVCTGGLGPTRDDPTREAVAAATGRRLVLHEPSLAAIRAYVERRGIPWSENQARQAYLPEGAEPLPNEVGTAPGILLRHGGRLLLCLPGPPRELACMWERYALPALRRERRRRGERPTRGFRRVLKVVGLPEALVEERLEDLAAPGRDPAVGVYVKPMMEVHVRLLTRAESEEEALARIGPLAAEVERRLAPHVYGRDGDTLPDVVGRLLRQRGLTLALAESCTGGLLGHLVTGVPGSSEYFLGSLVCYANDLKERLLGVPGETLARHGAVSEATARAMARGARAATGADVAVAVTGIAGPGGGTPEKPVGTVWLCVGDGRRELCRRFQLRGTRDEIKERAAGLGLALLRGFLLELPDGGVL